MVIVTNILKTWITENQEAILCQRHLKKEITFNPISMESFENNTLTFFIQQLDAVQDLLTSQNFFKTVSIVSHNSTRSNMKKNRGILFIGKIDHWQALSLSETPKILNQTILDSSAQLLKVYFEVFKASFWSGIAFGSYSWKPIPNTLVRSFKKRKFLPSWKNGKKISERERDILYSSEYLIVATLTSKGTIHATPVDFITIKNRLLFVTSFYSAKFRGFKKSNVFTGFTYQTNQGFSNYLNSLTISGESFAFGWNFLSGIAYNILFFPYLAFVVFWMFLKYPRTLRKLPVKSTTIRWQFMPFVARTFIELFWKD